MDDRRILDDAVAALCRYVRFDTTNPPGNEMAAALWLKDQILEQKITSDIQIHEPAAGRGLLVARLAGTKPLKPLMINHHIDVVAAHPVQWSHPPFGGVVADGFIWGRGTLDTKGLGVMFLFALASLVKSGVTFRRPVVLTAVPDEEPGGDQGMRWLVENHLADIDPEWVWDEGPGGFKGVFGDKLLFALAVAEKQIFRVKLTASGEPGHGSMPHKESAILTLLSALQRIVNTPRPLRVGRVAAQMFKAIGTAQKFPASFLLKHLSNPFVRALAGKRLSSEKFTNAVLRDTVSVNILDAGYQVNVIPERAEAQLDCRLLPETDAAEFYRWLTAVIADSRIHIETIQSSPPSGIAPEDSLFYRTVASTLKDAIPGAGVLPLLMAGATDGRYWRERGYPAYGFTPMILEKKDMARIHGIDERISIDNLRLGIQITREVIRRLCVENP